MSVSSSSPITASSSAWTPKLAKLIGTRGKQPYWLPVDVILDGRRLRQFQRDLEREHFKTATASRKLEEQVETWNERADALVHAFTTYSVPVMPFLTEDLDVAFRSAVRSGSISTQRREGCDRRSLEQEDRRFG